MKRLTCRKRVEVDKTFVDDVLVLAALVDALDIEVELEVVENVLAEVVKALFAPPL